MSYKFIKLVINLFLITTLYSCSLFVDNTKSPESPLKIVDEKEYLQATSQLYNTDKCIIIKRKLWKVLQDNYFYPTRLPDDKNNTYAIKTNFIEKHDSEDILNMNLFKRGSRGLLSLVFSCNKFSKNQVDLKAKYCIAITCKHCKSWEYCIDDKDQLHSQVVALIKDLFDKIN